LDLIAIVKYIHKFNLFVNKNYYFYLAVIFTLFDKNAGKGYSHVAAMTVKIRY